MSEVAKFFAEVRDNIDGLRADASVRQATLDWVAAIAPHNYTYNFTWLGRPVIQFPQDLAALQEIIWDTRPSLIIETGIAHGGSLIFHASMLQLLGNDGRVLGIDIDAEALENARHNVQINDLGADAVSFRTTPVDELDGQWPLVVANILAHILIAISAGLKARTAPHGTLILSGLIAAQLDDVRAAFADDAFIERSCHQRGEWFALIYERAR